ncbi:uncharacterized protein LOC129590072 [Paramacrobiotus metropolitanus]|uniref:uncharacterized protein LOC129590072 n=1 Tax=Paramacrobiotus metropolitanus TaxID=2943436 RepID=UPI002445F71D|nr:uncharacterized protein LOC129590072 [Paramacrobiotus metropolitanus]
MGVQKAMEKENAMGRNAITSDTLFKKISLLTVEEKKKLKIGGLPAVIEQQQNPQMGDNDGQTTIVPSVMAVLCELLQESLDAPHRRICMRMLQKGAWIDWLELLKQIAAYVDVLPPFQNVNNDHWMQYEQPNLAQYMDVHCDDVAFRKLRLFQQEANQMIRFRVVSAQNTRHITTQKITSSFKMLTNVAQFICDYMDRIDGVLYLISYDFDQKAFHQKKSVKLVPQPEVYKNTGLAGIMRQTAGNQAAQNFARERDDVQKRMAEAVDDMQNIHFDTPWFWRAFHALRVLLDGLSARYGLPRYVFQPEKTTVPPVLRTNERWYELAPEAQQAARNVQGMYILELDMLRALKKNRQEMELTLAAYNLPPPTNIITFPPDITTAIRTLEAKEREDPDASKRMSDARQGWMTAAYALSNLERQ